MWRLDGRPDGPFRRLSRVADVVMIQAEETFQGLKGMRRSAPVTVQALASSFGGGGRALLLKGFDQYELTGEEDTEVLRAGVQVSRD